MIMPKKEDKMGWINLYLKMQTEGQINLPVIAINQEGRVELQAGSLDNLIDQLGFVTGKNIFIVYTKTAYQEGKVKKTLTFPVNYSLIEVDV